MAKPEGIRLIAIGKAVTGFLNRKSTFKEVERILHYTRTAARHRDREIEPWSEQFSAYSRSINDETLKRNDSETCWTNLVWNPILNVRPEGGKAYTLTKSRKKLMFYYKNKFSELKNASPIPAECWDG